LPWRCGVDGPGAAERESIARIDLASDPPKNVLQQAAMQIFRGTNNTASVMGGT